MADLQDKHTQKVIFIINPVSGHKQWKKALDEINRSAQGLLTYETRMWEHAGQRAELIRSIREGGYDVAVAVGGDGTVNMVAEAVIDTPTALAIIPTGSGNGVARQLKVPFQPAKVISLIRKGCTVPMDCGWINGTHFVCTAGVGFDAHIGKLFASAKTRGLITYARITIREMLKYIPTSYRLTVNGQTLERKAFLITFANAAQYGNNVYIAPSASVSDGLLEVCLLKPFPWYRIPGLVIRLFRGTIDGSPYYERISTSLALLERKGSGPVHFDGEPAEMGSQIQVKVLPGAIRIISGT